MKVSLESVLLKISLESVFLFILGAGVAVVAAYFVWDHFSTLKVPKEFRAVADMDVLIQELKHYQRRTGVYPSGDHWLQVLQAVQRECVCNFKDPWGNDYVYRYPGKRNPDSYDLFSTGADHLPDTTDDVWSR